jgi:hypothetical protein
MSEQVVPDQPALPAGTYWLTVMLIGSSKLYGQTMRLHWPQPLQPSQLGFVAGANASDLVPDDLAGAEPGMWWLFQASMTDSWGRSALVTQQLPVDRSLVRDELAGELGRVAPETVASMGDTLVKLLTSSEPRKPLDAHWPSSTARH